MYEFDDEYGHHIHTALVGPPYEFNKPLTCNACIAWGNAFRAAQCVKYGWETYPTDNLALFWEE